MKIRNTLHFSDEIQEFCSDNYKIKKKINFIVVIYFLVLSGISLRLIVD